MSGGMPELGSKISLISKADIRYEGRLFTVDPAECTIALSSVRSFGTEDRETQYQIAPQSQIYDYILFRGSDIKDIRVVNNSLPTDPAIMQVQLPNGQHVMPHFPMPNINTTHAPPMGSTTYPFGNIGGIGNIGNSNQNATQPLAPGSGAPGPYMLGNQQQQNQQQQQQKPQTSQQQPQTQQQTQQKQPSELNHPITLLNSQQQQQQAQSQSQSQQSVQQNTSASIIPPKQTLATPAESKKKSQQLTQSLSGTGTGVGGSDSSTNGIGVGLISGIGGLVGAHSSSNTSMVFTSNAAPNDNKNQVSVLDMLTGASRSTTPISLVSRKSPLFDMGMQGNQQQQPHLRPSQYNQHQNQNNAVHGGNSRDAGHKRQNHQQQQRGRNGNNNHDYYHQQHDRRDSGRNIDNYNQHHDGRNNYNNQRNYQGNQGRMWNMHRGSNNANMMRNRGGGGRGRMPNQGFRPMGGPSGNQNKPRNNKNTIKFEQDFDFEQANTKFEELCSQLSKFKVGEEPKTEQINGETDKKDDSGNETGAGEHEPEEEEVTVGYDKTKSFFDNISCEAQDRAKNKKNDWRQERKLNSETFGVSSTRRGSYRGRPNYYNRNYSVGGAYNRGYRGGNNNYRNRSNNRMGGVNEMGNLNGNNASTTNAVANLKNQQPSTPGTVGSAANPSSAPSSATKKTAPQETNTPTHMTPVIAGQ